MGGPDPLYVFNEYEDMSIQKPTTVRSVGRGDFVLGALGASKFILEESLFSSSFTLSVSRKQWIPYEDNVEIYGIPTRIYHENGRAVIKSGSVIGNNAYLMSKRHPRHQSYRGHNTSSLIVLPNKNAIGIRELGFRSPYYGAFFRLRDGQLYGVVRNTISGVVQPDIEQPITVPFEFNMEAGATYNIQLQCPTAGNVKFMIRNPETEVSELVHEMDFPGGVPFFIDNPSMPFGLYSENTDGTEVEIQCRCVDISTEGGSKGNRTFASAPSGEVDLTTAETPMIALRVPEIKDSVMVTRDIFISKVYATTDSSPSASLRVYAFRDPTAISVSAWTPLEEGLQEMAPNGAVAAFDLAKMQKKFDVDIAANYLNTIDNTDEEVSFTLVHGDYLFITLQAKNNSLGKVTIAYSEEI